MKKLKIDDHPTAKQVRERGGLPVVSEPVDAAWLRQLALDCGADDAGLADIGRPGLANEQQEILSRYPWTKSLLSFVLKMSREPIRSPARSVANVEMHATVENINHVSGKIVAKLEEHGVRAVNPAGGFPMEMARFPSRIWIVSHKLVAVEAGLGHMGIHRNVIHPKFGNFILLGTVLLDAEATGYDRPIDFNPCLECNLCVAVCPVGAVSADGQFNFASCFSHNYREFLGGFNDWVEQIADSKSGLEYRGRVHEAETASFWQSLAFGPNYKSAYCMAVCPAGEDVIKPFLDERRQYLDDVVKPLQEKVEEVYVVKGSDAEAHTQRRFAHKHIKYVGNALHTRSAEQFLDALPYMFQRHQAEGLEATYHFTFTGKEQRKTTITIANQELNIRDGHHGKPNLHVRADTDTWLGFVAGERNLAWALLTLRIRLSGSPLWLLKFGKCFPSPGVKHGRANDWREPALSTSVRPVFHRNDPETGTIAASSLITQKWSGALRVSEVINETPNVKTFRLVNPDGSGLPLSYLPGQFLTLDVSPGGVRTKRSYTIASTPSRPECLEITVKREDQGLISRYLHDTIAAGDSLTLAAPSGTFTFTGDEHDSIVLVASGVGITPVMSVLRYLTDNEWGGDIYLLLGFRSPSDFIFHDEIAALAERHPNLHVFTTMSRPGDEPWSGRAGRIDKDFIAACVPEIHSRRVHICGPIPMMDATKAAMLELGVAAENLKLEAFGTAKRNPQLSGPQASASAMITVSFSKSGQSVQLSTHESLLDGADRCGVDIDNACRSGTCGSCKVRLLKGQVTMQTEDALGEDEKADGIILACQSTAEADVEVDA